jgi:hypothetical protein
MGNTFTTENSSTKNLLSKTEEDAKRKHMILLSRSIIDEIRINVNDFKVYHNPSRVVFTGKLVINDSTYYEYDHHDYHIIKGLLSDKGYEISRLSIIYEKEFISITFDLVAVTNKCYL